MRLTRRPEACAGPNRLPPNSALQRAAFGIKCPAAGGQAPSAHERWRARVLRGHLAVAELGS